MVKCFPNKYLFNSVIMAVLAPFPPDNSSRPSWSPGRLDQKVPRHRLLEWICAAFTLPRTDLRGGWQGQDLALFLKSGLLLKYLYSWPFSVLAPTHFIHDGVLLTFLLHAPLHNCNTPPPTTTAIYPSVTILCKTSGNIYCAKFNTLTVLHMVIHTCCSIY